METLWRDIRVGLRQLLKNRGFAVAAILTLTLGIGATSAMFSVVNAVLLKELPYKDPSRLVVLAGTFEEKGQVASWPISQMDFADWRRENKAFEDMSVFNPDGDLAFNLEGVEHPERVSGELVSASYFPLLGVKPAVGRFFSPEEDAKPFTDYVAVISHALWLRRFGGDPGVVGRSLQLNGRQYRVVGVAPEGFRGLADTADLWVPSQLPPIAEYLQVRRVRWVAVLARLKPGVTVARAQQEMNSITAALARQYPDMDKGMGVQVSSLKDYWFGELRYGLLILTFGALMILVIACINVANLLLARAVAEQRSYAISMALGASRKRLVRQLLTESLLLSLIGATLGLLLSQWATRALVVVSGVQFQSFIHISAGRPEVVAAIVGMAVLCGAVFGLVPMWITFKSDLTQSLTRQGKQPPKGSGRRRFQSAVVVAQVALAMILSTGAGLMAKGYQKLMGQELGFRSDRLLTYRIDLRGPKYKQDPPVVQLVHQYLDRLSAIPGIADLSLADPTIPTDGWSGAYITVEDRVSDAPDGTYPAMMHSVTPGYFPMIGVPILDGRNFTMQDTQTSGIIVSKAMADKYWPGQSPLNRRVKFGTRAQFERPWMTVLGVVPNTRNEGIQGIKRPAPDMYFPLLQFPLRLPLTINFLIRPREGVSVASLMPAIRREMNAVNPDLPMYDIKTMQQRLSTQTDKARFQILLVSLFSVLALILAAVGIYGVMAYNVTQGTREIAIHMSLGADRGRVLRMVVWRGALLAGLGLGIGLVAVLLLGRSLRSLLYETSATDPLILGGTCLALLFVTLLANYLPARRAARLDPVTGLRNE
jgi:predicted permease